MIKLPINIGDIILVGRFKNKRIEVKEIGKDEHGGPTINGRSILKIRIEKLMKTKKNLKEAHNLAPTIGGNGKSNYKPIKKGQKFKVMNYDDSSDSGQFVVVTALNDSFKSQDEEFAYEVGIQFQNGQKGWAYYVPESNVWEVGEGDYLGESKQFNLVSMAKSILGEDTVRYSIPKHKAMLIMAQMDKYYEAGDDVQMSKKIKKIMGDTEFAEDLTKSQWNRLEKLFGDVEKDSDESKPFKNKKSSKLREMVKDILKENHIRTFEDNCEVLQKFESQDKPYSKEAREILQDADNMSDEELDETVNDFMKNWRLTDPRASNQLGANSKPNPWDKDYRDGDFR